MVDVHPRNQEPVELPPNLPPVVYVPCVEHVRDPAEAAIELRQTEDGRLAIMVYSALDRLEFCCGVRQPWVLLPTRLLEQYRQIQEFDLVLLDTVIPEEQRTAADPRPRHTSV